MAEYSDLQSQKTVTAYFERKYLLSFTFARQYCPSVFRVTGGEWGVSRRAAGPPENNIDILFKAV